MYHSFDTPIIFAPLGAEGYPGLPGQLRSIVPVTGAEHLPEIVRQFALITVPDTVEHVPLQVRGTLLKICFWKISAQCDR
jgi:hypothetical protein